MLSTAITTTDIAIGTISSFGSSDEVYTYVSIYVGIYLAKEKDERISGKTTTNSKMLTRGIY
jgi:hypothetical protein